MKDWKTLSKEIILSRPPHLQVENHRVLLPDGSIIPDWTWIATPSFVIVVPITRDGHFLCMRQTKYAIAGTTLATPGGYLNPGEDPLMAAKRELREETGYEADTWEHLGEFAVDGNRGNGIAHFFLARGAHPECEIESDDLEEQELLLLSHAEAEAAVLRGAFKLLPGEAIMALALLRW